MVIPRLPGQPPKGNTQTDSQREVKLIQDFVQGRNVAQISRELGLSREDVARTIQPRALSLVARAFLHKASAGDLTHADPDGR